MVQLSLYTINTYKAEEAELSVSFLTSVQNGDKRYFHL